MARKKATIMLDRDKAARVRALTRSASVSDAVDIALGRYIADAALRHDVAAYKRQPMTATELALSGIPVTLDLDDEDVDYDEIYGRTS